MNVRLRQWMNFVVTLYREIPVLEYCFVEYTVPSPIELLAGIEEGHVNSVQENDWLRTFHPVADNQILLDLIDQL